MAVQRDMISTNTSSSPRASVADVFLENLTAGAFDQLGIVFEPDISLSALLPGGLREWHGPERVCSAFVRWFGHAEEYELLETAVGQVGPRLQLRWRARVRGGPYGDATFVVEQHVYADAGPTGRIQAMSMLCSGFAKEHLEARASLPRRPTAHDRDPGFDDRHRGNSPSVNITDASGQNSDVDPIDHEAATIDARSDEAREQIAELVEHAKEIDRDVEHSPIPPTDEAPTEETDDDPAITGEIDGD